MATATASKWTPFGVALDITATSGTVTRTSATTFTVALTTEWETYYENARTNYGMKATSGTSTSRTETISAFGTSRSSGSITFDPLPIYTISGNGSATKSISVKFTNYEEDYQGNVTESATKTLTLSVSVPAWTSYTITYNANGGSGAPANQTKWKNQTLTLSSTKPTRTGYSFLGWSTSSTATTVTYSAGGSYTANAAATLYAVWKANTYKVIYDANGGTGAPSSQTKTYGVTLMLSSTIPTRTNYAFLGWATSASATTATYSAGGSYTANAAVTLYAVWELSYKKPTISGLSVSRCTSDGTLADDGTCALVEFNWSTYQNVTSIRVFWFDTAVTDADQVTITASGTNGTVSHLITDYTFDVETSYTFIVYVTDSESTNRSTTMSGATFNIDFYKNIATAVGKPAEQLYDNTKEVQAFDVKWRTKFRDHVGIGEKFYHLDGKTGIFLSAEGYMHLQRSSAQGYHPYVGFFIDNDKEAGGLIRLNSGTGIMEFVSADGYHFGNNVEFAGTLDFLTNNAAIYGYDANGVRKNVFQAQNTNGNTVIGYSNYDDANGNTNVYGYDVNIGVSNAASPTLFRPYNRRSDTMTINNLRTAGYTTDSKQLVWFVIPLTKPIIGGPTITVSSTTGFILRQNDSYTHGSSASTRVTPTSYEAWGLANHGILVKATFSTVTNAINNAPIGIDWSGTITFS